MKLHNLKETIDHRYPPLTWNIVALKFFNEFRNRKINTIHIDQQTELPLDIQISIEKFLAENYKKITVKF